VCSESAHTERYSPLGRTHLRPSYRAGGVYRWTTVATTVQGRGRATDVEPWCEVKPTPRCTWRWDVYPAEPLAEAIVGDVLVVVCLMADTGCGVAQNPSDGSPRRGVPYQERRRARALDAYRLDPSELRHRHHPPRRGNPRPAPPPLAFPHRP
jgi:hypothetical protein